MRAGLVLLTLLMGCRAHIHVESDPGGADVFVTDYKPAVDMEPSSFVTSGSTPFDDSIKYWAWENYWVWVTADGYETEVKKIPTELKIGPALGGFFCMWPLWLWAFGPDEAPVQCQLEKVE